MMRLTVPESLRAFGRWQREGEAGRRWLAGLPDLVAKYCDRWALSLDGAPRHGSNGLAVPVLRGPEPLVLKVDWPGAELAEQVRALQVWDGRGAVRLIEADVPAGVLLLERLDADVSLRSLPLDEAEVRAGRLLRRLAVPAPAGFRGTWQEALSLRDSVRQRWRAAGRPFASGVVDTCLELADELAAHRPAVMVHADLHYDNVLAGSREPWLAIDPRPMTGAIEYQAGQLLWTRYDEIAAAGGLRRCLERLVDAAGMDQRRAHGWAVLRCVDYWLWGLDAGFTDDPARCRRIVAELLPG
jgi:streptomycin 6-kinase